ncbi:RHS repeat domain-containing protein [Chryseobacterium rhizosphaerae]|uniref:RHS repeat domain-containing protein n=1 Tax=Chryseobacterium rhizosphaerae TaxID=395937 RepID=UPI002358612B|nr:AHH domain-containing protein [Chryseobacterium rhizosphaerae]MDC8102654.1 cell well associated RhsD protein [Chryseobacterium rhizosphaerae]
MKKLFYFIFILLMSVAHAQVKNKAIQKPEKPYVNPVKLTKEERSRPYMSEVLKSRDSLTPKEAERRRKNIELANPFKKYGFYPKIATLSKGKYLEVHDIDSIINIGSVRFNRKTRDIVEFREIDLSDPDAQPYLDTAGRWFSPDPLSEEFSEWSPYNFAFNNPLKFVDPDGRAPEEVNGCCWGFFRLMPLVENSSIRPSPVVETVTKTTETTGKATNEHHLIPKQHKNHEIVKQAREEGYKFEGKENKLTVEKFNKATGEGRHANHPKLNEQIKQLLDEIPKSEALNGLRNLRDKAKDAINNNPDTKLNDLKLKQAPPVKKDNINVNNNPSPVIMPVPKPKDPCAGIPGCA